MMDNVDDLTLECEGDIETAPGDTEVERILATALEKAALDQTPLCVVLLVDSAQLDVLCSKGLNHEMLASLLGGLAESHRQAALEAEMNKPPEIHH